MKRPVNDVLTSAISYLKNLQSDYADNASIEAYQDLTDLIEDVRQIISDSKLPEQHEKRPTFAQELESLINRHSKENESNTPDFILASYLFAACWKELAPVMKAEYQNSKI